MKAKSINQIVFIVGLILISSCNLCWEFCCPLGGVYSGQGCNIEVELTIEDESSAELRIGDYFSSFESTYGYNEHDRSCKFSGDFVLVSEVDSDTLFVNIETEALEDNMLLSILKIIKNGEVFDCEIGLSE